MAINSDIRDQAYQFFVEEAPELLQAIETELLTLNQSRSNAQVHILMRAAHSLKGGAASVGLEAIAALAHRLETIFKALYSDSLELDVELEEQILRAYDCLRLPLTEQITAGGFDAERALAIAAPVFDALETRCSDAIAQTQTYIPSSSDMGIDMVTSIFEVDVAAGLDHLAKILANPQAYEVAGELRAQVEVFAGFAELLSLPEFGAIATLVLQSLDSEPDRAIEIAQQALTDFEASRQNVLSGRSVTSSLFAAELSFDPDSTVALPEPMSEAQSQTIATAIDAALEIEVPLFDHLEDIFGDVDFASAMELEDQLMVEDRSSTITDFTELQVTKSMQGMSLNTLQDIDSTIIRDVTMPRDFLVAADMEQPGIEQRGIEQQGIEQQDITEIPIQPIDVEWVGAANATENLVPFPASGAIQARQPNSLPAAQNQPARPAATPAANLTVRVDSTRLEKMNNLVGEMAINRDALSLQNDQMQGVVRELLSRFGRFQKMVNQLQELSDQMLVAPERYAAGAHVAGNGTDSRSQTSINRSFSISRSAVTTTEFDSLEMDTYGALHPQLQEILENVVQLEETVDDIALFSRQSNQMLDQQRNRLSQLQDEVIWARMLPIGEVLNRFPRILRDLSLTYRKPVQLKLTGTGVLIEKAILEKLYDPLLHLLRNAFDHGIEAVDLRQKRGKPDVGQIEIRAYHKGNQTIVEVKDDGKGLSLERIRSRVFELGWLPLEQLAITSPAQLFEFIFEPGFSTADRVSELSGRGIGLNVVRSQLQLIKGNVTVTSQPEKGAIFTLSLPLTLTITKLIICLVNSTPFALPADSVEEILSPKAEQVKQSGNQRFLQWQEQVIPIYRLSNLLAYTCPIPEAVASKALSTAPLPQDWASPILVLRQEQQLFALEVDRLVTEQELVIKPFGAAIAPPSYTYGCTVLGDGSLVPVVDGAALLAFTEAKATVRTSLAARKPSIAPTIVQSPTILVVDDAVTLRRTLALSLERAGFRVLQARDGREALAQLQQSFSQQGSSVKLVVCDVEMPNMNGFELLSHRRQDPQLAAVPIVMLTSRSNEKHRWLAMQLGATDYFTKPYLEQEFLGAIDRILSEGK